MKHTQIAKHTSMNDKYTRDMGQHKETIVKRVSRNRNLSDAIRRVAAVVALLAATAPFAAKADNINWNTSGNRDKTYNIDCASNQTYTITDNDNNTDHSGYITFKAPTNCKLKASITTNNLKSGDGEYDRIYLHSASTATSTANNNNRAIWQNGSSADYTTTGNLLTIYFDNAYYGNKKKYHSTFTITVECYDCPTCDSRTLGISGCPSSALSEGNTAQLTATPSNGGGTVTWTSSAPSIVSVNSSGLVTAEGPGTATITASIAADGDWCAMSNTCVVSVACGYSVPVCFDFEDYATPTDYDSEDSGLPPCWNRIYSGSSSGYAPHVFDGSEARDGNGIVMTSGWSSSYGNTSYAIMPYVDGIQAGDTISFNAWWESTSYGTLTVGYMTDPSNASTFVSIGTATAVTYSGGSSSTGINNFVVPAGMPSGAVLAFKWNYNSSGYYLVVIDNICIFHPCTQRSGSMTFSPASGVVMIGNNLDISSYLDYSTLSPSGTVAWSSNATGIATVTNGVVHGVAEGNATITATIPAGEVGGVYYCEKTATFNIVVSDGCAKIGNGSYSSSSGYEGGIYTYYNYYAYTQQVYTASEILAAGGCTGKLTSIALHYDETTSSALTFEVYLGTTNQTSVPTTWITNADLTMVYSGTTTFTSANNGWNSINVSAANWEWDGESNIVVAIRRTSNTSGAVSYPDFYYTYSSGKVVYLTNSSSSITLDGNNVATSNGTSGYMRPEIKFCIDCCTKPNFSFADNSLTIYPYTIGNTYTGLTPNVNQSGGTVTYESSNPSVVEVNATTGRITVRGTGSALITATVAKTGEYCSNTATYTVIIPCGTTPHTLTYNTQANCTGGTASSIAAVTGTSATVTTTVPNCSSANHFTGWNTSSNGNGTQYSAGQAIDLTCGDLTLYAMYSFDPDTIDGASDCADAMAFCASNDEQNGVILTASTDHPDAVTGMCSYFKNPSWWYIQISDPGRLEMTISSTAGDVDFGCWGPFKNVTCHTDSLKNGSGTWYSYDDEDAWGMDDDPDVGSSYDIDDDGNVCGLIALAVPYGNLVDFGGSSSAVEYLQIDNAQEGDYYIVLVANYSSNDGVISFTQTNLGQPGAGGADCNIVSNCDINTISALTTACNTANNSFTVSGVIHATSVPADGTLTITDVTADPPVSQVFYYPSFSESTSYTLTVPSDGAIHQLEATFASSTTNCTKVSNYKAPDPCVDCSSSETHTNVTCYGANNGTITLTSINGRGPRAYYIGRNGATPTLSDSLTTGTLNTYTWSNLQPGTYTVFVRDTTGCKATQENIIITEPETFTITPSSNGPICLGNTVTLNANPDGGTEDYGTITWTANPSASAGLTTTTGATIEATPTAATTIRYTALGEDANHCPATGYVDVVVNALPPVNTDPFAKPLISESAVIERQHDVEEVMYAEGSDPDFSRSIVDFLKADTDVSKYLEAMEEAALTLPSIEYDFSVKDRVLEDLLIHYTTEDHSWMSNLEKHLTTKEQWDAELSLKIQSYDLEPEIQKQVFYEFNRFMFGYDFIEEF
ncbi:MAG: Ig-like domain-containing protein, partial [Bacteroidales bacterium]|nr:Ig-like domain-containing protein [Bacteroidales bacterium]